MAKYITLGRDAVVQDTVRPAGWHGFVHDAEYERLVEEKAFEPAPAAESSLRHVTLARDAEVWGVVRPAGWHGHVTAEEYAQLEASHAFTPPPPAAEDEKNANNASGGTLPAHETFDDSFSEPAAEPRSRRRRAALPDESV